ncbi:type II secretion system protein [Desulfitobacterium sp. PCE1]|uniref:type II secretion system protein n=1 Tax=Desulfitobacterium sp. PCE1 TaxID=146907 RepID=UPI00035D15E7|nr:type II secretion system protein [Desulfitobacterium sp. PCE1]
MQNIRGNQKERLDRIGQDRGFTLIEVLFALLITGILLTVALRFFTGSGIPAGP